MSGGAAARRATTPALDATRGAGEGVGVWLAGARAAVPPGPQPLVLHVFPSFAVGGAQVRTCAVANRFGARWRHAVVALDGRHDCAARLAPGVPVALLGPPPRRPGPVAPLARLAAIRAALRALRPDVLVTSNWGSVEWVAANRPGPLAPALVARHVHTEDGFGPDETAGAQHLRRVLARRLLLRRSTVVLPSRVLLGVARGAWALPPARLRHVPNGLDLARFRPRAAGEAPDPALGPPGDGLLVGTVAALRPEKNLARLLRAFALLRGEGAAARLVVVGDGPERGRLEALAADLGLLGGGAAPSVRFAGALADPAAAYRAMDAFALSSDTEQMPFSVLEAMASGLAVASTDVGDVGAMLSETNRPHLAAADADGAGLAAALRPLLADAGLRARLGAANRARAEGEYDQEAMFAAHAALLDGGGPSARA